MFIERSLREKMQTIARSAEQAVEHYAGEMASKSQGCTAIHCFFSWLNTNTIA
jgi:hypothetical protein